MNNTRYLELDFYRTSYKSVKAHQYDKNTRFVEVTCVNDASIFKLDPATMECTLKFLTPDGRHMFKTESIQADGTVLIALEESMLLVSGICKAELNVYDMKSKKLLSTMPFDLIVIGSVYDNLVIENSDEFNVLNNLIFSNKELNESLKQLESDITEAESVRKTNENERINNENIRRSNETTRQTAETDRKNNEDIRIKNEKNRISNEGIRQIQEADREEKTSAALQNAQNATQATINATNDLQSKLDNHHFVLTEDKDIANGIPSLDTDRKIPIDEMYDATTESKGIVQLTDSVTSTSTTTAATPNSVKTVFDALTTEKERLSNVENKSSATIRSEITKSNVTNALGYTPYTPNEVDNKLSTLETNIDWKESVNTFNDIASTYPNPQDGWTVNVKDTDYTYRYNGSEWVAISANAIPKATNNIDGLLSKEDHTNYDDANSKKHTHNNKSVLDSITEDILNKINNFVNHNHDDRYYTKTEIETKLNGNTSELTQVNEPTTQKKGDFWLQEY